MKYQWYVVDLDEGTINGSNDVDEIRPFVENDRYLVFTAQHGVYCLGSTVEKEVQPLESEEGGDLGDEDDD